MMPGTHKPQIRCPKCGREKGLSLHVSVQFASVRIPVTDQGRPKPCFELLRETPMASDQTLLRYSDTDGQTRITLHREDAEILINCPQCQKMHILPEGTDIECNDVG